MRQPSRKEIEALARANSFQISNEEAKIFGQKLHGILSSYEKLNSMSNCAYNKSFARRDKGFLPRRSENKFEAWAWKCSIKKEKTSGVLAGKRVAIKDNVAVAGIPMHNGSSMLKNYIPLEDATVVKRILDAGGEIVGKAQCENFCVSGGSHTSYPKPVRNPRNPKYMAGGSSSGSAALLGLGEVDLAIGGDQAGSIRIPSSWCGVYGLKSTWGLVPYTGAIPMEMTLDHLGPMANSVEDIALLLKVIAGRDEEFFDPRQRYTPSTLPDYTSELRGGIKGMKIGLVKEGFGRKGISEQDVDEKVRSEAFVFEKLGARVKEVAIPEHIDGFHIWTGLVMEGAWNTLARSNGLERAGCEADLVEAWAKARKNGKKLPPTMKLIALAGNYVAEKYDGKYYALARSLARKLKQSYDIALDKFDLLLMPTTPQKAQRLKQNMSLNEYLDASMLNLYNTCPFDATGHPALNVPCGLSQGLPVGMMLVGKHYDEATVLKAAFAYERLLKGKKERE